MCSPVPPLCLVPTPQTETPHAPFATRYAIPRKFAASAAHGDVADIPEMEGAIWYAILSAQWPYPSLIPVIGPVFSLNMAGQPFVVLNNVEAADELFGEHDKSLTCRRWMLLLFTGRRSNIYSDRPRLIVAGEIMSKGLNLGLMRYGPASVIMYSAVFDPLY